MSISIRDKHGIVSQAIVDSDDYEHINQYKWTLNKGYAVTRYKGQMLSMHRLIMNCKIGDKQTINHINRNKIDNRKINLEESTRSQNSQNKSEPANKKGKYVGVKKEKNAWICRINFNYCSSTYRFDTEDHAAHWYNCMVTKYYGDNAKLNNVVKPLNFAEPNEIPFLPLGIRYKNNIYTANLTFCNKKYFVGDFISSEEAIHSQNKKWDELFEEYKNTPVVIERNSENIAMIRYKKSEILLDDDEYNHIKLHCWYIRKDGYVCGNVRGKTVYLHRYIVRQFLSENTDKVVDHININPLDNRKINLRFANYSENGQNKHKRLDNSNSNSKYVGVSRHGANWKSYITKSRKTYCLGNYKTQWEAAEAYNKKALELYGSNAKLNLKQEGDENKEEEIEKMPIGVRKTTSNKFNASVSKNNNKINLGTFSTKEYAESVYKHAKNLNTKEEVVAYKNKLYEKGTS